MKRKLLWALPVAALVSLAVPQLALADSLEYWLHKHGEGVM